uniref:Uncharacterized protein n=1 Tax=Melopsittacus undulatus TaxID=13146 RepID=A0A8V5GLG7_MELUD
GTDFPRLIINQFKWLDKALDSQDLVKNLMQLVSVSPVPIQHDIITSLPEILEDSQVDYKPSGILSTNITVSVNHGLTADPVLLSPQVRQSAMTIVPSVKLEDLPVVIKFILHNVKATDAVEVISDLRKNLDLSSCDLPLKILSSQKKAKSQVQASSSMSQVTTSQNCVKLLFDVIKLAVRFQKEVSEAWIKAIENSTSVSDHKVLDLMILLLIHSTNTKYRKQAEKLLKNKIQLGCMPEQLMQNAFQNHSLVIKDFFPSILAIAQTFLHSGHPAVVSFGSCMYKQAFAAFDSYCQQEVVSALVTHVCSGNETELDISLDVLTDLVVLHTSLLMRYATFVKTILDSTQKLHPCQIRKLFYILSTLAYSQRQERSYIQDDMHMVIRKWLSSTVPNHKQMGIIGAVTMIAGGTCSVPGKRNCSLSFQLSNLLDLVGFCCEQTPEVLALYYDEFANLIEKHKGNLDLQFLDFPSDFVVDLSPTVDGSFLFPVKSLYNLDEDETQGAIAINLLPLLSQNNVGSVTGGMSSQMSPLCLSPCFRLLRFYTAEQNSGSLEEIDALLGCPLYLTNLEVEGKLDSLSKQEREFLCSLLFYALNWFREVVNAFCQQQDAEMKGKVLTRLQNITELQNVLGKCLAGKKRKTDGSKASSADHSQGDDSSEGNQPDPEETENPLAKLQNYRLYFRELDLEVFTVLHCGLLTKSVLDTEMHTEFCEVVQLGPAELSFLLDDLCWKLEHVLTPGSTRRVCCIQQNYKDIGFSHLCRRSPKEVAICVVKLLKPLCNHMENMHNYFQVSGLSTLVLPFPFLVISSESFHYLLNFQQSVPNFHCAFILTQLLITITKKPVAGWKKEKIASLAKQFLCQSWVRPSGDGEKGSQFNNALHTLLCIYLEHTDNILKAIEEISSVGVPELINSTKDGCSSTYPTLTRQTFLIFFRVMMAQLESSVKSIPVGKTSDSSEVQLEKLLQWNIAVRNFHILINLVKVRLLLFFWFYLHVPSKYGRLFVEAFLKLAMPLLDYSFKKHRDDVQSLLKTLQLSTRQLHHMCGHSKIHQDIGLTNHVPLLKKSLEQFVYRVKAMLAFNHCQEAFWMGVLKNRDLQVRITVLPGAIQTWERTVLILPIQLCPCVWVGQNSQIQCDRVSLF